MNSSTRLSFGTALYVSKTEYNNFNPPLYKDFFKLLDFLLSLILNIIYDVALLYFNMYYYLRVSIILYESSIFNRYILTTKISV